MKTKRSFLLSMLLHAGIISGAIALSALPEEEKEEEIVLELALAEPSPPQPQPAVKPISQPKLQERVEPAPKLPVFEQAEMIEESKPQIREAITETKTLQTPHVVHAAPNITPPVPELQPATPPVNVEERYLDDHLGAIREILVKYRKYPNAAVRLKQEGSVRVSFRLMQNGEIEDVTVVGSSGHEILDEDAVSLIRKTAGYFPKPPKTVRITVPLNYALRVRE